jgi:hypothetical protein
VKYFSNARLSLMFLFVSINVLLSTSVVGQNINSFTVSPSTCAVGSNEGTTISITLSQQANLNLYEDGAFLMNFASNSDNSSPTIVSYYCDYTVFGVHTWSVTDTSAGQTLTATQQADPMVVTLSIPTIVSPGTTISGSLTQSDPAWGKAGGYFEWDFTTTSPYVYNFYPLVPMNTTSANFQVQVGAGAPNGPVTLNGIGAYTH